MDAQFWIKIWNEGRTGFHQAEYHEKLTKYFPQLSPKKGQTVFVPLCGKTKDLLWLHGLGLNVHGVELHAPAVESFFTENSLSPKKVQHEAFIDYSCENIRISCGDFFKLNANATYDFVYDRAALVALPPEMRKDYAQVIKRSMKMGGKCLLVTYEYDQTKLDGPPFSVLENEVHELYGDQFTIKLMESETPSNEGPRLEALGGLQQKVYILEKILSSEKA